MNTDRLFEHVKTDDIYKDIAEDFETRFCTSNCEIGTPLPKEKNKIVIRLKQDELGGQIMKEFTALWAKTYSYLKENHDENKKLKIQKRV